MKSIQELQAIRDRLKGGIANRDTMNGTTKIVVGMATCGIAAGARPVMTAFVEELTKRSLANVKLSQAGCIGMCKLEPIVEIYEEGKPKVTYVHMTPEKVNRVVSEHIVNGQIVKDYLAKI